MTGNSVTKLTLRLMTCQPKPFKPFFNEHMKLSKKLARWLPNLTDKEMKKE
jgi:hypothetical protein